MTQHLQPDYTRSFQCIGPACEDTCCSGWTIAIDQPTHEKYKALPTSPLRTQILKNILPVASPTSANAQPHIFAKIRLNDQKRCPLHTEDRLCSIQSTLGESYLSQMCATYPRIQYTINGTPEQALSLSCPQAARHVLLNPALLAINPQPTSQHTPSPQSNGTLQPYFFPIRDFAIRLIQNRAYPLWQRMFLLGTFSRRLDAVLQQSPNQHSTDQLQLALAIPKFLNDFNAALAATNLLTAMDVLPSDHTAQLDVVLQLAGLLLSRSNITPRFIECIQAFTQGIGNGPTATLQSLTENYSRSHDLYYASYIQQRPHVLENYLINTIFRCQFPFGRDWSRTGTTPTVSREFILLTTQFALVKGLLIGISGTYREHFADQHLVHTIQTASKHFEHHPEFLTQAHALLVSTHMDDARGNAILLRNRQTHFPQPVVPTVKIPAIKTPSIPASNLLQFPALQARQRLSR